MEDIKTLRTDLKEQEYILKIKRRWLANLPLTRTDKKLLDSKSKRTLPESFLREDDVFYETIKKFVESGINGFKEENKHHLVCENMLPLNLQHDVRFLLPQLLDDMTNECLCSVAGILTHGLVKYENIRCKMIKVIKDHLQKRIPSQNTDLYEKLSPILKDPRSYRQSPVNNLVDSSQSYEDSVVKVLNGLGDLPQLALVAMERKLKGIQGHIPQIKNSKRHRDVLITNVRRTCMEMLSKIGERDEVREPLNKAMAVAGLYFKLILGCCHVKEFRKFPAEVEALQMKISKAILVLGEKNNVRFTELEKLQLFVDPAIEKRRLRHAVKNLLMEYLFECCDMDSVPEWFLEVCLLFNKESRIAPLQCFSKDDIEEEVECILSLGAQTKQIVWDLSTQHEFDHDFANSYMEDLEESDDEEDNVSDDYCSPDRMHITCTSSVESSGHDFFSSTLRTEVPNSPTSMDGNQHSIQNTRSSTLKMTENPCARFSPDIADEKGIDKKPLLVIQGASDETSLFVYRLVGHMLVELAQTEGLQLDFNKDRVMDRSSCNKDGSSSVIQLLEQLLPSYRQRGKDILAELTNK